ncbi:MAG: nucleotide exchange factor GrpE [Pseudoflavonifractor sp.]|nr:nucleotide exchange factor GrpE [Pseudoflavonifractor sp.]
MSDNSKRQDDLTEEYNPQDDEIIDAAPEGDDTEALKDELQSDEETVDAVSKELEDTKAALDKEKREYMFLMAEFDNYKKRTLKEKSELIRNAAANAMRGILPVVDDMERAIAAMEKTDDVTAVKDGVNLIYNKFMKYLEQNGVKEIPTNGTPFDTEYHEAITTVPVENEDDKGKVIDTVAKGYTINDKVLRHAKVVVGQ